MTDQHRATPEQWEQCANDAELWSATHACLLELRDRVEALEKAQRPVAGRFQPLLTETVYADSSVPVEGLVRDVSLTLEEAAEIVAAQRSELGAADSLVERVASVLHDFDDNVPYHEYAHAAIREVAVWFRDAAPQGSDAWRMAARALDDQAAQ